uniref:Uncharacterized protein n=1 Tax=Oryza nivara TaxID=4536 RepID=A0A0E0HMR8_ORYNI
MVDDFSSFKNRHFVDTVWMEENCYLISSGALRDSSATPSLSLDARFVDHSVWMHASWMRGPVHFDVIFNLNKF